MRYKALVFDFFGVVCNEIGSPWFVEHHLGGDIAKEKYVHNADVGTESQAELFAELEKLSGIPAQNIEREWEGRARFNTGLIALIKGWRAGGCKAGLLSNAPSPFFRTLLARSGFESIFDAVIVSSEIGHAKPDPQMYLAMLEKLGVAPADALMVDDRQDNVDGALAVGMAGHLYTGLAELTQAVEAE